MGLLYTNLKIFHHQEKLASLTSATDAILPPIHMRIKPTNVCNHNCRYCAYRSENMQLGKDMNITDVIPKLKMRQIAEDIVDMGVKAITFSGGGEPFCYPYLHETALFFADHNVSFASLTNGSRLTGETAEVFAHHGTWVRISMDGWDDASYSDYRGVKDGEFSKILKNIEAFKKLGGQCYLGVSIIVDANNAPHQYELIGRLVGSGVDSVKISPCIIHNDGKENNAYHEPFFQIVKEQVARAKEDFTGNSCEIYDSYHLLEEKFNKTYSWCPYLQILPVIGADLNVYSCQDKAYSLPEGLLGSVMEQGFKEFWNTDKSKFFRIDPSTHCNHHCVANQKNRLVLEYLGVDQRHAMFV